MSKRHSNIFQWTATLNKLIELYITGTLYKIRHSFKRSSVNYRKKYL